MENIKNTPIKSLAETHYRQLCVECAKDLMKIPNWIKYIYKVPLTPKWVKDLYKIEITN